MPGITPTASAPLAALGVVWPVDVASETLAFATVSSAELTSFLSDGLGLTPEAAADLIHVLAERIRLTGSPLGRLDLHTTLTDGVAFELALATGWQVMLAEGIEFAADVAGTTIRLAAVVDSLHMSGLVSTRIDALAVVSAVLAINALDATGWKVDAIDTLAFQDALSSQLNMLGSLLENIGFDATPTPAMRVTAVVAESLALGADPSATMDLFARLSEEVLFYTTIRLGADEYVGWVLNEGAPSEYRNYPFNGYVDLFGTYYGTTSSGLYELAGADDDGEPIEGWIKTALMDFGTGKKKRLPDVYVAFAGGDKLLLKVILTDAETGDQVEHWYESDVPPGTALHNGRIKVGRGLAARYWQLVLKNINGAPLEVDTLELRPLILDRRI